jgi:hypothetical protein
MGEVAGLVVGGIGLLALFETSMTCFDYIDTGRKYGKDYQKFVVAMSVLELRLSRWGDLARLRDNSSHITGDEARLITELLGSIKADLEDAGHVSKRYELKALPEDGTIKLQTAAERFKRRARIRQHRTSVGKKVKWALRDQGKCNNLIKEIERGIADLELVFPYTNPQSQLVHRAAIEDAQQLMAPTEVEADLEPSTTPDIETLREATENDRVLQQVLDIVTQQTSSADEIRNIFTSGKARVALDDFVASGYTGPAPTERTRQRVIENVGTTDEARLLVGKNYGGKGVFDD